MVRRSRAVVIQDILTEALDGSPKTKIMYRCNLNFLRFDRYFDHMVEKGLIEVAENPHSNTTLYKTTEKGKTLLKVLKKAQQFIEL